MRAMTIRDADRIIRGKRQIVLVDVSGDKAVVRLVARDRAHVEFVTDGSGHVGKMDLRSVASWAYADETEV